MVMMMTLPPSNSNIPNKSASQQYERLNKKIQRWIYDQGWAELHDIQEHAIRAIYSREKDVIIAAATASGKTEAAFLPICSAIMEEEKPSVRVVYLSPLKALINDQYGRLSDMCKNLEIPVTPWHGDISAGRKRKMLAKPGGILLITPESLEAMFINRGTMIRQLFGGLGYVIIDELHSFIGTERGKQLQSLIGLILQTSEKI